MVLMTAVAVALLACRDLAAPIRNLLHLDTPSIYLNAAGPVVVHPGNMHGWYFYDHNTHAPCASATLCAMVNGPGTPPAGTGSAELATVTASEGKSLMLDDYRGLALSRLTQLDYWALRQNATGAAGPIKLHIEADFDLADGDTTSSRLTFQAPGDTSASAANVWQHLEAKTGAYWFSVGSVMKSNASTSNPCVQAAPCTLAQFLERFPNLGVHATRGSVYLRAGPNFVGFRGNVDALGIGIDGVVTTFNFELSAPSVPATAPLGTPQSVLDSVLAPANLLVDVPGIRGTVARHTLYVRFVHGTTVANKDSSFTLINAEVIGGMHLGPDDVDGAYHVRLRGAAPVSPDSTTGPLRRARALLESLSFVKNVSFQRIDGGVDVLFRRPLDGAGFTAWRLNPDSADGDNWHLEAIAAPFAWGCDVGGTSVSVAVVDKRFAHAPDLDSNVGGIQEYATGSVSPSDAHGTQVAAILAARGNNSSAITGTAPEQRVGLYDANKPSAFVPDAKRWPVANIMRAAGANRIVNVSMGRKQKGTPTVADSVDSASDAEDLAAALGDSSAFVVLAAGNDGVDAKYSGYPLVLGLEAAIASRTLVVAGTQRIPGGHAPLNTGGIKTNGGAFVEIAAPGVVTTIGTGDALVNAIGTSVAAPQVAGAAALLLEFDPSLTPAEIKKLRVFRELSG